MRRLVATAAVLVLSCVGLGAYVLLGYVWPNGSVVMQLQLGSSGTLIDGTTSWGQSAEAALAAWNPHLRNVQFTVVRNSTAALGDGNNINNVFWSSTIYGSGWPTNVLAVTTNWSRGSTRTEADVIFNTAYSWNSYSGPLVPSSVGGTLIDFRRVALHEFGHVLGLNHPDQFGQSVAAIMNSLVGNTDSLQADDIAGVGALYGGTGPTLTPPGAPTSLATSAVGTTVTMTWRAPTTGGTPSSYFIASGSSSGRSDLANFSTGSTATSFSADRVGLGTYYVRVRATNAAGTSAESNESILVVGGGSTPGSGVPGAPTSFVTSAVGTTVTMTWRAPTTGGAPTTYYIASGSSSGRSDLANFSTGSTTTSYSAERVGLGTYYVRVRAANASGTGAESNESILVVGGGSTPGSGVPGAPTSFVTSAVGTTVTMSWRAPTTGGAPTTYYIASGSSSGLSDLAYFSTASTATSFSAERVGLGTYYVRVRAANASGTGAESNESILVVGGGTTPGSGVPGAPTSFATSAVGTTVTMTWRAPTTGGAPTTYYIASGSSSGLSDLAYFSTGSTATSFSAERVGLGTYYVRVRAANASGTGADSNESILVVGGGGAAPPVELQNGVAVSNLADAAGGAKRFRINVPSGRQLLVVSLSAGSGDADLYVRRGQEPTIGPSDDCSSIDTSTNEMCTIQSPAADVWYITVYAYLDYAGVTLKAIY